MPSNPWEAPEVGGETDLTPWKRPRYRGCSPSARASAHVRRRLHAAMQISDLRRFLDEFEVARPVFASWGLTDASQAHRNFVRMAEAGVTLDLLADISGQLAGSLPTLSDPDMALNNLERFVTAARNPLSLAALFERDRQALP